MVIGPAVMNLSFLSTSGRQSLLARFSTYLEQFSVASLMSKMSRLICRFVQIVLALYLLPVLLVVLVVGLLGIGVVRLLQCFNLLGRKETR
jgi:hypothetical protein